MKVAIGSYWLRDFNKNDAPAIAKYANNPRIAAQVRDGFPHPYHLSDAEAFLAMVTQASPRTIFAISTDREAIGSIGFHVGSDVHRRTAEMGYWLAEPYWGRGIMTMAVQTTVEYAFRRFRLNRVYAMPYETNPASARVLEKVGFTLEGVLRAHAIKKRKVLDCLMYAITADDLEAQNAKQP
jgi:RimJ/RimL family protein N-acetyltransferase